MYEQVSHSLLNEILNKLDKNVCEQDLRYFFTRLGANFYTIHSLFHRLYGERDDFKQHMCKLVETLTNQYTNRAQSLRDKDIEREKDHNWFLHQRWTGMALYTNGFSENLQGLEQKINYFQFNIDKIVKSQKSL